MNFLITMVLLKNKLSSYFFFKHFLCRPLFSCIYCQRAIILAPTRITNCFKPFECKILTYIFTINISGVFKHLFKYTQIINVFSYQLHINFHIRLCLIHTRNIFMAASREIIFYNMLLLFVNTVIKCNQTVRLPFVNRN